MNHKGKRLFITGIPTSGKSYLAKQLAEKVDGVCVLLNNLRENLSKDENYKKWTNFYLDRDEEEYLANTSEEQKWNNLTAQSEGLWPAFMDEIAKYSNNEKPVIFECVNILPHLANKDLDFSGIVLIGSSFELTLERNMKEPRWGNTKELQGLEAKAFFFVERPKYKSEAEKYGFPVFEKAEDAFEHCLKLLS